MRIRSPPIGERDEICHNDGGDGEKASSSRTRDDASTDHDGHRAGERADDRASDWIGGRLSARFLINPDSVLLTYRRRRGRSTWQLVDQRCHTTGRGAVSRRRCPGGSPLE